MHVDLRDPRFIADPYPLLAALRAAGPVHETLHGLRLVVGYQQVNRINRDPRLGRDPRRWAGWDELRPYVAGSPLEWATERFILHLDPPAHTRLRRLVASAFTPRRVAALAGPIAAIADDLLDAMAEQAAGPVDLMSGFARPLPVRVILTLLGLPETDLVDLARWSDAVAPAVEPLLRRGQAQTAVHATGELLGYLREVVAWRRARLAAGPAGADRDDLLSALLRMSPGRPEPDGLAADPARAGQDQEPADTAQDPDGLAPDEVIGMLVGLFIAGHETTTNLIGNGILALAGHPRQWALLRADPPGIAPGAVEEVLRYDSPVQANSRVVLEEIEIGGTVVPPGTLLISLAGAANRDPAVFADPDRLDLTRDPNPHLSFGGGAHFCLGAGLARLEGRIAFERLAARLPRLEVDLAGVRRRALLNLRGLECLPLRLAPAGASRPARGGHRARVQGRRAGNDTTCW